MRVGAVDGADSVDRDLVRQTCGEAHGEVERLKRRCDKEAILRLREEGHGTRTIARVLNISRGAAKRVCLEGSSEVPRIDRAEKAEPYRDQILELYPSCKGNVVRVHEELVSAGAAFSYNALTAFCRRHGIGHEPRRPAGQYHFEPGEEMQHDTSLHEAEIGGRRH